MRALLLLFTLLLLTRGSAQVFVSNAVTRAEAIKVASQLRGGMSEENASEFVGKHGLTNAVGMGADSGWGRFYLLTDGSNLVLDYGMRSMFTNDWWEGKGVLERAYIQSNGVNILSITFTNVSSSNSPVLGQVSYEWSESLMLRKIHLSPKHPADSDTRIRLISVGKDSTATIRLDSGQQLTAKPGEYFACEQFGSHGLQLVSTSPETGTAELQRTWSETR